MANYFYAFVFVIFLALPLIFFTLIWRKFPKAGITCLLIYLLTYIGLSLAGKYVTGNRGGNDWQREWCPKGLIYASTAPSGRATTSYTIGAPLFWPCILIDHLAWHRTHEDPQ